MEDHDRPRPRLAALALAGVHACTLDADPLAANDLEGRLAVLEGQLAQ